MHWLLLEANTLTAEPATIAKFESEQQCKTTQQQLVKLIATAQNDNVELNSGDGPWVSCKALLKATELP